MTIPSYIKDKKLYQLVKNHVIEEYPKHSAYRSMKIIDMYKDLGGEFTGPKKNNIGLSTWIQEKWINLIPYALGLVSKIEDSPKCGGMHPKQKEWKIPSICRPSVKVNNKTPRLA